MIHIDICGPITLNAMDGYKYFITFINDYSRFGWIELLAKKSKLLNTFKTVVELKLGRKIKCVHFDKGGEYYGRYDETNRNLGPFTK